MKKYVPKISWNRPVNPLPLLSYYAHIIRIQNRFQNVHDQLQQQMNRTGKTSKLEKKLHTSHHCPYGQFTWKSGINRWSPLNPGLLSGHANRYWNCWHCRSCCRSLLSRCAESDDSYSTAAAFHRKACTMYNHTNEKKMHSYQKPLMLSMYIGFQNKK